MLLYPLEVALKTMTTTLSHAICSWTILPLVSPRDSKLGVIAKQGSEQKWFLVDMCPGLGSSKIGASRLNLLKRK